MKKFVLLLTLIAFMGIVRDVSELKNFDKTLRKLKIHHFLELLQSRFLFDKQLSDCRNQLID